MPLGVLQCLQVSSRLTSMPHWKTSGKWPRGKLTHFILGVELTLGFSWYLGIYRLLTGQHEETKTVIEEVFRG